MTARRSFRSVLPIAALLLAAAACSDTTGPTPIAGALTVSLASATTDGAIFLTLKGPELPPPQPANPSSKIFWRLTSSVEMRVMVFGTLTDGPLFTLSVPDVGRASDYAGTVLQVADRNDALRTNVGSYGITVSAGQSGP